MNNSISFLVLNLCSGIFEVFENASLNLTPKIFPFNNKVPKCGISLEIKVLFLIELSIYSIIFCIIIEHSSFFIPKLYAISALFNLT